MAGSGGTGQRRQLQLGEIQLVPICDDKITERRALPLRHYGLLLQPPTPVASVGRVPRNDVRQMRQSIHNSHRTFGFDPCNEPIMHDAPRKFAQTACKPRVCTQGNRLDWSGEERRPDECKLVCWEDAHRLRDAGIRCDSCQDRRTPASRSYQPQARAGRDLNNNPILSWEKKVLWEVLRLRGRNRMWQGSLCPAC